MCGVREGEHWGVFYQPSNSKFWCPTILLLVVHMRCIWLSSPRLTENILDLFVWTEERKKPRIKFVFSFSKIDFGVEYFFLCLCLTYLTLLLSLSRADIVWAVTKVHLFMWKPQTLTLVVIPIPLPAENATNNVKTQLKISHFADTSLQYLVDGTLEDC